MPQLPVDPTGRTDQSTLLWDGTRSVYVVGPAAVAPLTINLADGDTLDDLGPGRVNRHPAVVEYDQDWFLPMTWSTATSTWYSDGRRYIGVNDGWALDLTNQLPAAWKNMWCQPLHGVGWYHGSRGCLASAVSANATTFTVEHLSGTFSAAGLVVMQGDVVAYTGITDNGNGTFTFTGVPSSGNGHISAAHAAHVTPIYPYENVNAGDTGGWGITADTLLHAKALYDGGFRFRDRFAQANINGSQSGHAMDLTVFLFSYDFGSGFTEPNKFGPPTGALGHGQVLTGPDVPGRTGDPSANRTAERSFDVVRTDWAPLNIVPDGEILDPRLYIRMPDPADDTGEAYAVTWEMQITGTP